MIELPIKNVTTVLTGWLYNKVEKLKNLMNSFTSSSI